MDISNVTLDGQGNASGTAEAFGRTWSFEKLAAEETTDIWAADVIAADVLSTGELCELFDAIDAAVEQAQAAAQWEDLPTRPEPLTWIYTWGERLLVTTGGRQRTAVVVEGGETPTIKFTDNGERGPIPAGATVSSGAMLGCEGW